MAEQKKTVYCINSDCKKELQVKVKYCPFCGTEYVDVQLQVEQAEQAKQAAEAQRQAEVLAAQAELERQNAEQEQQKAKQEEKEQREKDEKFQAEQAKKRQALEQKQAKREAEDKQEELARQQAELAQQKAVSIPPPPSKPSVPSPPPFQPEQPKKGSSGKYVVIAFIVIIIVIVLVFSGEDTPTTVQTEQTASQEDMSCETAINEINNHLQASKPSRALTIVQMYQSDCKKDSQFIELATQAESQSNAAKAKLNLAKEYLQKDNFAMAATAAQDALDIDNEVVGANELLQEIETLQQQHEQEQVTETEPTEEMPSMVEPQVDAAAEERRRAEQAALVQQKADLERQKAELERQKAEEAKRKVADARQQIGSNQVDPQITTTLINADKALRMKNYSGAKRIAREVLASSPNNAQALRIVRQAEESEAKAFDNMVIE